MKIKVFSILVVLLFLQIFCIGQQLKNSKIFAPSKTPCEKTWHNFDIGNVSICVPGEVRFKQKQGVDQRFWHYESATTEIAIFDGARAPVLHQERGLSSFKSRRNWIGEIPVEFATFVNKKNENLRFTQTARVILATKPEPNSVMIYIKYQEESYSSIAEMILNSIYVKN